MNFFKRAYNKTLDLLFPPRCLCCTALLSASDSLFCADCALELSSQKLRGPLRRSYCRSAKKLSRLSCAVSSYIYKNAAAKLVIALKRAPERAILEYASQVMAMDARDFPELTECDVVVPVPRYQLGYNHSRELARSVAKRLSLPLDDTVLLKHRKTAQQHTISTQRRLRNLAGAFVAGENARGKRILLCDDVVTSGETLDECAAQLLSAGAVSVCAVTFASAHVEK